MRLGHMAHTVSPGGMFTALHELRPGAESYSAGVDVALLAGLPQSVALTARRMGSRMAACMQQQKALACHQGRRAHGMTGHAVQHTEVEADEDWEGPLAPYEASQVAAIVRSIRRFKAASHRRGEPMQPVGAASP